MSDFIPAESIDALAPPHLSNVFRTECGVRLPYTQQISDVFAAFWNAASRLAEHVDIVDRPIVLFAGQHPGIAHPSGGLTAYHFPTGALGWVPNDATIVLNTPAIAELPPPTRIAVMLEELVHCVMHVHDEDLTARIVALIFPEVEYRTGKYHLRSP